MRKLLKVLVVAFLAAALTGCGATNFYVSNQNASRTSVELTHNNFKFVKTVSGFSSASYIFGIGGASMNTARENAVEDMFKNANLKGAQTITNIYVKQHVSTVLGIYTRVSFSASGVVVEFTK